ncbi:ThuA domain-containing protein [Cellulophaga sp. L1A9]|uniref:ThuA domain-containing protein n=1 Tax=Cellulophaga sp. L1A9 TaxID=2686362 RepID=UPI00131CB846|nr:ThuA domain-containing protein [Cellulophaga sp. L1A9]
MNSFILKKLVFITFISCGTIAFAQEPLSADGQVERPRVLNFHGDNGHVHKSKQAGINLIETLGQENGWEVVSTNDTSLFTLKNLFSFDVILFNNTCGNRGRLFSNEQQQALQHFIRNGGGFVGIHCAGALWHEGGEFQKWYEELIGTRLVDHPKVQPARLIIEDNTHISTQHLKNEWRMTDEWHRFSSNPRAGVNVLISLDEDSYEGEKKMGGDHPFTWYQYVDGGRSFFTSLGHTVATYEDENFKKLVKGGIEWAAISKIANSLPVADGLLVDLNADHGVTLEDGSKIGEWKNQVEGTNIKSFIKQDIGRKISGSGRPRLLLNVPELNGHNTIVFHRQELLNHQEDAFDHLTQGSGYTWFSIMAVYEQVKGKPGVNSFFGNLRNTNMDKKGQYEGFWGGMSDENKVWISARNGLEKGLWNKNSPHVIADEALEKSRYYLVMGRMGEGQDTVNLQLFVNSTSSIAEKPFIVNPKANPSKMAIGQERDATNHPGAESFDGEIARCLIYEKPLNKDELAATIEYLKTTYNIQE